jgi:hypothetical protein
MHVVIINSWYFEKRTNPSVICTRSSGALNYIAEWILIDGKYQLKYLKHNVLDLEYDMTKGCQLLEVDTIHDVIYYCATHNHPDFHT